LYLKLIYLLTISNLCLLGSPAFAQSRLAYRWNNVQILGGGFVSGIVYSPAQKNLLYARTDVGGAYRWQEATQSWVPITDHLGRRDVNYTGILSVAPDPSDAKRVYLAAGTYTSDGVGNAAVLASNDQGATWTTSPLPIKLGGNENGRNTGERLQVDPNLGTILYLGTTLNGLWRSQDRGATWSNVERFPVQSSPRRSGGISFVLFDKRNSQRGRATRTIYVGVLQKGNSLFRSTDAGATWQAVPGQPTDLMPHHAALAADGTLYLTYNNGPGPSDVTAGDVRKYEPSTNRWTSIRPAQVKADEVGGFGGIALDPQHAGTLLVSTLDRWRPGDDIFRSTDGGKTWRPVLNWRATQKANLLYPKAPYAATSNPHWIGDVALDPFNPNRAWFVTGYGVFATHELRTTQATPRWSFDNQGLEETVPLGLISPPVGAPLMSAIGDIDGFRHDDLTVSPKAGRLKPEYSTNLSIDFAEQQPAFMVRAVRSEAAHWGAYSEDGGTTWAPFASSPPNIRDAGFLSTSSDGHHLAWRPDAPQPAVYHSADRGNTWTAATNGEGRANAVADRVNPLKFYRYDVAQGRVLVSTDGAASFAPAATGLPTSNDYRHANIQPVFGREGDLWLVAPGPSGGLFHSIDAGQHFQRVPTVAQAWCVGTGKSATAGGYPALYLVGTVGGTYGFFRSDDQGATWQRINDDQHQYGGVEAIVGDRRTYGRVYLQTGGRGIVYGEPIPKASQP